MKNTTREFIDTVRSRFNKGEMANHTTSQLDYVLCIDDMEDEEQFVEITNAYVEYADEMILNFEDTDQDVEFRKALLANAMVRVTVFDGIDCYPLEQQERIFNCYLKAYAPDAELNSQTLRDIYLNGSVKLRVDMIEAYNRLSMY